MDKTQKKLKNIKAVAFDADGVLFTGRVFIGESGEMMKERSHIDGHGIFMLRKAGIKIAFVTAEKSAFLAKVVEKFNSQEGLEKVGLFLDKHGEQKVEAIGLWLKEKGLGWRDCAAMGDDLTDVALLQKSAFAAAPGQAEKEIKKIVDFVVERKGGDGAIRDFCNLILKAKGINIVKL